MCRWLATSVAAGWLGWLPGRAGADGLEKFLVPEAVEVFPHLCSYGFSHSYDCLL